MTVDKIGNTAESPIAILEKVGIIENQPIPSMNMLEDLAALSVRTGREYGVQLYETDANGEQRRAATYKKGERGFIFEPDKPQHVSRGVFLHTHYEDRKGRIMTFLHPGKPSWYTLPSDAGLDHFFDRLVSGKSGDIVANFHRRLGGYLNIVSPYGVVLHIGVAEDPSNRDLEDSQWEILSGIQRGRIYTPKKLYLDRSSVPDPFMVWRQRWPYSNSNFFLLLSWGKIHELTPVFTDLNNLCFGDGIEKIVQYLQLDFPHQKNLSDVIHNKV